MEEFLGQGPSRGTKARLLWSEGSAVPLGGEPYQVRVLTLQGALGSSPSPPRDSRDSGVPWGLPRSFPGTCWLGGARLLHTCSAPTPDGPLQPCALPGCWEVPCSRVPPEA